MTIAELAMQLQRSAEKQKCQVILEPQTAMLLPISVALSQTRPEVVRLLTRG